MLLITYQPKMSDNTNNTCLIFATKFCNWSSKHKDIIDIMVLSLIFVEFLIMLYV